MQLDVPPHLIAELVPPPSPARITALTEVIQAANAAHDWYMLDEQGTLRRAPEVTCPPGDAGDA